MNTYPFALEVFYTRRPHMRDDNLEYLLHIGTNVLRQVFDDERVDPLVSELVFFYPERWMNIVEERSLYQRLEKYYPNLKKVTITTQSVYILQCTKAENIKIISSQDEIDRGLSQESDTGRLWNENCHGYNFNKLQAM